MGVKISLPALGPTDGAFKTGPNKPDSGPQKGGDPAPSVLSPTVRASHNVNLQYTSAYSAHDVPAPETVAVGPTQRVASVGIRCGKAVEGVSITIVDIDAGSDTDTNTATKGGERAEAASSAEHESDKNKVSSGTGEVR